MKGNMAPRNAFTLIELLVVIAIIALLMAILMPSLGRVRQQAKASACQSNLHQWSLVFSMYDNDHDGRFCNGCSSYNTNDRRHWATALRSYYYNDREITLCPTATKPYDEGGEVPYGSYRGPDNILLSYGLNGWAYNARAADEAFERPVENFWRGLHVQGVGNIPLFLDCLHAEGRPFDTDEPPAFEGEMIAFNAVSNMVRFCLNRHHGTVNCLFMDASLSKVPLKHLWSLKWHRNFKTDGPWTKAGGVTTEDWPQWMRGLKD
jgi:prepilin-type N-terminal cleavage/methylation domain-containing protein